LTKGAKFAGSVGHPMTKMLSASGGLRPPPDQGLCPWAPLGALPPDPRYRLVLRIRHGPPPTTDPFHRLCVHLSCSGSVRKPQDTTGLPHGTTTVDQKALSKTLVKFCHAVFHLCAWTDGQTNILITKYTAKVTTKMQSLFTKRYEIDINVNECVRH